MWPNFIGRQIRRANRNLLLMNLALLLGLGGVGWLNRRYLANCLKGPRPISAAELSAISDPDGLDRYFVTVQGDKAADTGGTEENQTDGITTSTDHYLLLRVGERALLVKAHQLDLKQITYSGALTAIPYDVSATILAPIQQSAPDVYAAILPYELDATSFRESAWIGLLLVIPLALLALWNIKKFFVRLGRPADHPIARALARYGDPEHLAEQIDGQLQQGTERFGGVRLTQDWLVYPTTFGCSVMSLPALVWIYEKITTQKYMGVIPMGKTITAELTDAKAKSVSVSGRRKTNEALLQELSRRAPWAIFGFSEKMAGLVKNQFAQVVAAVEERRKPAAGAHG